MSISPPVVKYLGLQRYEAVWLAMQEFTDHRNDDSADEIWLVEHHPVYTLGRNGKPEHILHAGNIPVIHVDRGGQVTFHGPGQLVAYVLCNLKQRKLNIREMVVLLENAVIQTLQNHGIEAVGDREAPGVYVDGAKIASLGLRVRRGCTYHGLSINVKMDLEPFSRINPCGYAGLRVTQMSDFDKYTSVQQINPELAETLCDMLAHPPRFK